MSNKNSLEILINKVDTFIRLYYKNRIIRGIIYSVGLLLVFFLIINLLEYFSYFGTTTRTILFYGYILLALGIVFVYIIIPILKLFRIGKRISHVQAAEIISSHFPEVGDKLINTLQLGSLLNQDVGNIGVIEAAIAQKTERIKHIPFTEAIDKKENVRKAPYALAPLLVLLLLLLTSPGIIREPIQRISNYNIQFEKPMPFRFDISDSKLVVLKGDDLDLIIKLYGSELPAEVTIEYDRKSARTVKIAGNEFIYRFRNLNNDLLFRLQGGGYYSDPITITVLPKPVILNFDVKLDYPAYTGRNQEIITNAGDLSVPIGTFITWSFDTEGVDSIIFRPSGNEGINYNRTNTGSFQMKLRALESFNYTIIPLNAYAAARDSMKHQVTVIPDLYPEIQVESFIDSANFQYVFNTGQIRDDYGFEKLVFSYRKRNVKHPEQIINDEKRLIPISRTVNNQSFFFSYDFSENGIDAGDKIEYWFEVWDNDMVNGSKMSRTGLGFIEIPGLREQEKQISEKQNNMSDQMSQLQKAMSDLSREINQLQRSILQKESISWEDTNKLQELLDRQIQLQKRAEKLKDENTALNQMQEKINPFNEEIIKKQQELQKLFDELMTDEMKKLFEELQKLVDELDRGKMQDMLNKMQISNEELMNSLDRNLELFKQLEMEKMITDAISKLKQLAEEQEKLAHKTEGKDSDPTQLDKEQESLVDEFEQLREKLDEIRDKNEDLEWKYEMIDTEEMEQSIKESMEKSRQNLQKNNKPGAAPNQRDASKKMNTLSESLMEMMMRMQNDQLGEDIRLIRKLLENLIDISFDQELLIDRTISTNRIDPRFNELLSEQKRIIVSLKQVEDSLNALARRQLAIQQFVLREIAQINLNVEEALKTLEERNTNLAGSRQQFVMTSVNNLALMLAEAMEQMMLQMMTNSSGGESCPMPGQGQGKGKPSMNTMKGLQQELNRQMEQMRQSMGKPGEGNMQQGGQSMSEQFARMAAQQEALRRQMQQYLDELRRETGKTDGNAMKAIEEMEQTEKDLVNKRITNETLLRQERILTRLLESEKAEMERERDEKRESRSAQNYPTTNNDSILEFYRKKMNEKEMLRTVPAQMNTFYRTKVNDYFIQVQ